MPCIFCEIATNQIKANVIYEDNDIIIFMDNDPINEGHVLIIPRKHYLDADEIPKELYLKIMDFSQRIVSSIKKSYSPSGYSIMQNGGDFNDIGHYHLHIFPRYNNDGFGWTFSDKQYDCDEKIAEKLKTNM